MRIVTPDEKNGIYLGRQGENLATQVQFDVNVAGWVETYGVGTWQLLNRRPSDPAGYPVEISVEDNIIKWDLTATDLKYAGCGTCELVYYVDEVIAKSIIYGTQILPAIDGTGEIPEPWESWIDEVEEARDEAQAAAEAAAGSASSAEGFAQDASASAAEASDSAYAAGQSADAAEGSADTAKDEADRAAELADQIEHSIDDIEALIPPQASPENQLADKNFVNSSISTNTANYISNNGQPFTSVEQLEAYSGPVSNNDYAFVTGTDSAGNTFYDRYKATVAEGVVSWAFEYRLNNSSFTAAQWAAIESGITASQVADYNAHLANRDNPHSVTKEQVGLGNVDNTPDAQKPVSQAQAAALALKADKVVDAVAGDFAALDENGNLTDSGISPSDLELVKEVSNDPANSSFDIVIKDAQAAPVLGAVLKGKTVAINQLVQNGNFDDITGWSLGTVNNHVLSATLTAAATFLEGGVLGSVYQHKYYVVADLMYKTNLPSSSVAIGSGGYSNILVPANQFMLNAWTHCEGIIERGTGGNDKFRIYFRNQANDSVDVRRCMFIDLSVIFTALELATIGTSVDALKTAWLKKYGVPLPQYIPYNAGSILSNNATYQLHGKNLFEPVEADKVANSRIAADGSIESMSGWSYYTTYEHITAGDYSVSFNKTNTGNYGFMVALYDENQQFLQRLLPIASTTQTGRVSGQFTVGEDAHYFRISFPTGDSIQIERGVTATDFIPYYDGGAVQADDLNGFDGTDVFDSQTFHEKTTRCKIIDLGTLEWGYESSSMRFYAELSDMVGYALSGRAFTGPTINTKGYAPLFTSGPVDYSTMIAYIADKDKVLFGYKNNAGVVNLDIKDTAYNDAAAFKTAMSGVYFAYELETPVVSSLTPPSLSTQDDYNVLEPVSGDLQSGEVSMTYVKSSWFGKAFAWILDHI